MPLFENSLERKKMIVPQLPHNAKSMNTLALSLVSCEKGSWNPTRSMSPSKNLEAMNSFWICLLANLSVFLKQRDSFFILFFF